MLKKIDCIRMPVPGLELAPDFYGKKLGLELVWKRGSAEAGLKMKNSDTEVVLVRKGLKSVEVDMLVDSADRTAEQIAAAGGKVHAQPFDIVNGRCAVVADPWGNSFVVADMTKGPLRTDNEKNLV